MPIMAVSVRHIWSCPKRSHDYALVTSEGYRYPQAEGERPFGTAFRQWYVAQIFALSSTHQEVYGPFMQVLHLLKDPAALFAPAVLGRVLKHSVHKSGRALAPMERPRWGPRSI